MDSIRVNGYPQELSMRDLERFRSYTPERYAKTRSDFISVLVDISHDHSDKDYITNFMLNIDDGISYALAHMCKVEGISFRSMIKAVLKGSNCLDENDIEFHKL